MARHASGAMRKIQLDAEALPEVSGQAYARLPSNAPSAVSPQWTTVAVYGWEVTSACLHDQGSCDGEEAKAVHQSTKCQRSAGSERPISSSVSL